ncbi:hypothetical protein AVEN_105669-1 [Araneus ventricosus]|uniref:Uncharacterized protein n=1 Tax=Araneus ventricosus TaxID=182803 RepID=A0A4Y2S6Z4_ARAVE|nr:hypothetical protein AVEN_105669-1 [Araneus ventricosus]
MPSDPRGPHDGRVSKREPAEQFGSVRPREPQQTVELKRAASPGAAPEDRQQTELRWDGRQSVQGAPQPPALPDSRDGHLNDLHSLFSQRRLASPLGVTASEKDASPTSLHHERLQMDGLLEWIFSLRLI